MLTNFRYSVVDTHCGKWEIYFVRDCSQPTYMHYEEKGMREQL